MKKALKNFSVSKGYGYYPNGIGTFRFITLRPGHKWENDFANHGIKLYIDENGFRNYKIIDEEKATMFILEWG